jgi:hypothetical protein
VDRPTLIEQYGCGEYFQGGFAERGYTSRRDGSALVVPEPQIEEIVEHAFLAIGRAGGGATLVGYRARTPGVWAYTPNPRSFEAVGESIADMISRYESGQMGA